MGIARHDMKRTATRRVVPGTLGRLPPGRDVSGPPPDSFVRTSGVARGRGRRDRCGQLARGVVAATVLAGCAIGPFGDTAGYGPWLEQLVAPIAILDAGVVRTGTVNITVRDAAGNAVDVQTHRATTVDDVTVVSASPANDFERHLVDEIQSAVATSQPLEMLIPGGVRLEPGRRYRIFVTHAGLRNEYTDLGVRFAWDLAADRPADGISAPGWRHDVDAVMDARLAEGSRADAIVTIAHALVARTPTDDQQRIVVMLVGESMLPSTLPSPPTS